MEKSLFAQYSEEREGKTVFETEDGFVSIILGQRFYVEHLFIKKDSRGKKITHQFEIFCINFAKSRGYKEIFGSVAIGTNNPEFSLVMMLNHGWKLSSANQDMIFVKKDIF
jgi:GNAT superfamily N-acetyltransferase